MGRDRRHDHGASQNTAHAGPQGRVPSAGDRMGPYRLERAIAQGRRGVAYEATDENGARVLVKVLPADDGRGARSLAKARHELTVSGRIEHPGIRRCHRVIKHRRRLRLVAVGLVAEYVPGGPLRPDDPPALGALCALVADATHAIEAVHAAGFVHADLKPDNFLFDEEGALKVIDLDQSVARGARKGRYEGTRGFRAPEQIHDRPLDRPTDVFGVGATLYAVLTGRAAPVEIEGGSHASARAGEPVRPSDRGAAVPPALDALVAQCLAPDPASRPPGMGELRERLELARERAGS